MKKLTLYFAILFVALANNNLIAQVVNDGGDNGGAGQLRQVVADADPGDEITFGLLVTNVTLLQGEITIDKNLTINGGIILNTTIDGDANGRIFNITNGDVTLNNLNITNGLALGDGGGAIRVENASLVINDSNITNNVATDPSGSGGGILVAAGATLEVNDSEISNNVANRAGGGIEVTMATGLAVTLNNVNLDGNNTGVAPAVAAPGNGGGLHVSGSADILINGGTVNNNTAAKEGGGLWNNQGTLTINGTTISNNDAQGDFVGPDPGPLQIVGGGGIFSEDGVGTVIINEGTTISGNFASGTQGSGGGILMATGATLTINGMVGSPVTISGNAASRAGGGIEDWSLDGSTNTLTNVNFENNTAGLDNGAFTADGGPGNGGALHVTGPGINNITESNVTGNLAAAEGGGLWNGSATMTIDGTTIDANTASGDDADNGGGGIYNLSGTLSLTNSTVTNNVADGTSGSGGGILNDVGATFTAVDSEISGNTSNRAGGGIEDVSGISSLVSLTNVTLDGNTTGSNPGNGGGLHVSGNGDVTIIGGTVSGNTAAKEGGGLWNNQGTLTINGTTIADNVAQGDFVGPDPGPLQIVGGGAIFSEDGAGTVIINEGTTISGNFATGTQGSGGGILMATGTTLTINGTTGSPVTISNNAASRAGGGIEDWSLDGTTNTITNVNFENNTVGLDNGAFTADGGPGNGGAVHVTGPGINNITGGGAIGNLAAAEGGAFWNNLGTMTIDGVTIDANIASGNDADNGGGGVFNNGGTLNILNGTEITGNIANGTSGSGGGLLSVDGEIIITDSTFTNVNTANRAGGAIEIIDGNLTFINSEMSLNNAIGTPNPGNGGGLHVSGMNSTITIDQSIINQNSAANEGGGLWNQAGTIMNVSRTSFSTNSVVAGPGGAVYNNGGDINIETSTFTTNTATAEGGAVNNDTGNVNITRSTFNANSSEGNGGTIHNNDVMDINAVTISDGTTLSLGAGIFSVTSTSLKNTIVANNVAAGGLGQDVAGTFTSNGFNLIGTDDANAFPELGTDQEEVDPILGILQDNGGATQTQELLTGSPAIDAGDPSDSFLDQRNFSIVNARDIGAYEFGGILGFDDVDTLSNSTIYPNPTNGNFTVELSPTISGEVTLRIVSITGQLVREDKIETGTNNVNLTGMTSGMYLVSVETNSGTTTHKLILR